MELHKIITFLLLSILWLDLVVSVPTFGEEFVHIKVHIPEDVSNTHGVLKATYEGSPAYPHTAHKVVHHYHRRRKSQHKKLPQLNTGPLLENIILSELDRPQTKEHGAVDPPFEETFVVKEQHSVPKVNTFIIEETVKKPVEVEYEYKEATSGTAGQHGSQGHVETIKIIESKRRPQQPILLETIKVLKGDSDHHYHAKETKYEPHSPVETIKLVEDDQHDYYTKQTEHLDTLLHYHSTQSNRDSKVSGYNYQKPQHESIKIIKTPNYKVTEEYNEEYDTDPGHHYHYEKPEEKIVIKSRHNTKYSKYHENEDTEDYAYHRRPGPQVHESIEVFETKHPQHVQHSPEYEKVKTYYEYPTPHKEVQKVEEKKYPRYRQEYTDLGETEEHNSYHYSPKGTKVAIDEDVEYRKSAEYKKHSDSSLHTYQRDYKKPSKAPVKNEEYGDSSARYLPHVKYGVKDSFQPVDKGYNYSPTAKHNGRVEPDDTDEYPSTQPESFYPETLKTAYHYKHPSSSHTSTTSSQDYLKSSVHDSTSDKTYKFKPSPQFTSRPMSHQDAISYEHYLPSSKNAPVHQNTLFDELSSEDAETPKLKLTIDWPEGVAKAAETYSGHDSYSAAHVQGLGSGGYSHHSPYL